MKKIFLSKPFRIPIEEDLIKVLYETVGNGFLILPSPGYSKEENSALFKTADFVVAVFDDDSKNPERSIGTKSEVRASIDDKRLKAVIHFPSYKVLSEDEVKSYIEQDYEEYIKSDK